MKCNVGSNEKVARVIMALIFAILGYYVSPWFYLLTLIGIVTAAVGYCPLTSALGINTCKK